MKQDDIKLVPKKKSINLNKLFEDKKKRYPMMLLIMLPFIIGIAIFSVIVFREVNNLMALAKGPTETKASNIIKINDTNAYILRDNATDLQQDLFAQLKDAIESEESEATDVDIASLVAQNFVADFYTWTNKQGSFDVGGMYYIYDGEFEDGDHFKENVYQAARYGFYQYLSYYASQYGTDKLIEVESIEVTKANKMSEDFVINEHVANMLDENGDWYDYREDHPYPAYEISCRWNYKEDTSLVVSNFAKSLDMLVIDYGGRYLIVEASEDGVHGRIKEQDSTDTQEGENEELSTSEEESESETE